MSNFNTQLFSECCERLNMSVDNTAIQKLEIYASLLREWNKVMNLTAADSPDEIAVTHFADSLSVLSVTDLPQGAALCDVGTGAGFPGLPIKICRDDIRLVLIDSLQKRTKFLQAVVDELGLQNVELYHLRAEEGGHDPSLRERFDVVTSRAVAAMPTLCEYCLPYVKVGGTLVALKGPKASEELELAQNAIKLLGGDPAQLYTIPLDSERIRTIITVQKSKHTHDIYPRKSAQISKKPL